MLINRFLSWFKDKFAIHAMCEVLTCKYCGQEYASRGKKDPGYCKECEENLKYEQAKENLIGGPLGK